DKYVVLQLQHVVLEFDPGLDARHVDFAGAKQVGGGTVDHHHAAAGHRIRLAEPDPVLELGGVRHAQRQRDVAALGAVCLDIGQAKGEVAAAVHGNALEAVRKQLAKRPNGVVAIDVNGQVGDVGACHRIARPQHADGKHGKGAVDHAQLLL